VDYQDPVRIELWIAEIRASRFVVEYEMYAREALASRARSVCVPFDLTASRPRRLSPAEQEFLEPWQG
jgi:acyl-CoA thioester hydrolase